MIEIPENKVDDVLDILRGEATGAIAAGELVEINPFYLDELLVNYRRLTQELEEERRWIPVSEKLPEDDNSQYLTLSPQKEIFIMCWNEYWSSPFASKGDESVINVTHWRPLPQLPKDEEKRITLLENRKREIEKWD